jgi:hypothetical protein
MEHLLAIVIQKKLTNSTVTYQKRFSSAKRTTFFVVTSENRLTAFEKVRNILLDTPDMFTGKNLKVEEVTLASISDSFPKVLRTVFNNHTYDFTVKPKQSDRVRSGADAQNNFANYLIAAGAAAPVKIASPGSQEPDVVFTINNTTENAEIKSSKDLKTINIFDVMVYRKNSQTTRSKDISFIDDMFKSLTGYATLEEYIDSIRLKDTTVGYKGDKGVVNQSGYLPSKHFNFTNSSQLATVVEVMIKHWLAKKDDYFVVNSGNKFKTSRDDKTLTKILSKNNNYDVPVFNSLYVRNIKFLTFGNPRRNGAIRLKFEITLNTAPILAYNPQNN